MSTKTNEAQMFITILCFCIDELIRSWNTARELNYSISPNEPGYKANYCSVKLGLTTLESKLPYDSEKWWFNSTVKGAKGKWPDRPQELQSWKERATALKPNTKICFLPIEINITNEKIEKFIRTADETIDIQKHLGNIGLDGNKEFIIKGKVLNELSLELGLIDPDWYLAKKCNLLQTNPLAINPQIDKENFLKVYNELGINPNCTKQPFMITNSLMQDGYIDKDELKLLVENANTLMIETTNNKSNSGKYTLGDLKNPVLCSHVAAIIHKRSDNVARTFKSHKYPVVLSGKKYYCDAEHAAVIWPKWKIYWQVNQDKNI